MVNICQHCLLRLSPDICKYTARCFRAGQVAGKQSAARPLHWQVPHPGPRSPWTGGIRRIWDTFECLGALLAHSWHNYLPDLSRSYHSCLKLLPLVNCSILLPLMTLHKLQSLCAIWRHQTFIRCICVHVPTNLLTGREPMVNQGQLETSPLGLNWAGNCPTLMSYAVHVDWLSSLQLLYWAIHTEPLQDPTAHTGSHASCTPSHW